MCVLSEVCYTKTVSVKAGQIPVPLPVAGDGSACGSTTRATLDTLTQVLPSLACNTPHISFTKISLSLDSCTREES
jgi:hypothetical protein